MVHMPSHIYIRTGQYEKAAQVNEDALSEYNKYLALYPEVIINGPLYDFHSRHMKAVGSMNGSNYSKAIKDAMDCRKGIDSSLLSQPAPIGSYVQFVYMTPLFTLITFEKWKDILEDPETSNTYSSLLQHFARGIAYANTGQIELAKSSLHHLQTLITEQELAIPFGPFSSARDAALVAEEILLGSITEKQGHLREATEHYQKTVKAEDALIYNEPKDWLLPARRFLGAAYLKMNNHAKAEFTFSEDLKINPKNPKSLKGLEIARKRQGKKS